MVINMSAKNIAIIAFDCNPYGESESLVSWKFVEGAIKNGHKVFLITKLLHKENIEKYISNHTFNNLEIRYCNSVYISGLYKLLPQYFLIKKEFRHFSKQVLNHLREIEKTNHIDIIHRVTPNSIRLTINLSEFKHSTKILGPCGGFQETPKSLYKYLTFKQKMSEKIHFLINTIKQKSREFSKSLNSYDYLYVTNHETYNIVCKIVNKEKIRVLTDVGVDNLSTNSNKQINYEYKNVLFVGRFLYRKGISLIPLVARELKDEKVNFIMVGDGPELTRFKQKIKELGVEHMFSFTGRIKKVETEYYYKLSDVFLFLSFRESSGNVLAECLQHNLPVICFDTGGNKVILKNKGIFFNNYKDIVREIAQTIIDNDKLKKCLESTYLGDEILWNNKIDLFYDCWHK